MAQLQHVTARESAPVTNRDFSKNPLWAPGIALMRNMRFGVKALLIGLMFLVPMIGTGYMLFSIQLENIDFSAKESLAIPYMRGVFLAINATQNLRRVQLESDASAAPSPNLSEAKALHAKAHAQLADLQKQFSSVLNTEAAFRDVEKAFADLQNSKEQSEALKFCAQYVNALTTLLSTATDSSNLTLDPVFDSYYLMDATLFREPVIVESVGKLYALGLFAHRNGRASTEQQHELASLLGEAEFQVAGINDSLKKAVNYNPALRSDIDADKALGDLATFFSLVRKNLVASGDLSSVTQKALTESYDQTIKSQFALMDRMLHKLDQLIKARIQAMKRVLYINAALLAMGLSLAGYFFYCFYLVNRGGLWMIRSSLKRIAQGDLRTPPPPPWGTEESAKLVTDLRTVYNTLHLLISKVHHSSHDLGEASHSIAAASVDLSARTESCAAALEQQAAAMEQMGSTVKATADRTQMATTFAKDNAKVAEEGGKVFGQVVSTMSEIQASSGKIADIIGVIDAIAFQTNILALNAAVEAARAGESGRGFAVVATEVRSLAGRSASAAQEIKALISNSVQKVDVGTRVIVQASRNMEEVVANAQRINDYLTEIATAAREQAVGVQEVGRSIQDLDKSTQQNAMLVQDTTKASKSLSELATSLKQEVEVFKV